MTRPAPGVSKFSRDDLSNRVITLDVVYTYLLDGVRLCNILMLELCLACLLGSYPAASGVGTGSEFQVMYSVSGLTATGFPMYPTSSMPFAMWSFFIALIVIEDGTLIICVDKCNTKGVTGHIIRLFELVPGLASF